MKRTLTILRLAIFHPWFGWLSRQRLVPWLFWTFIVGFHYGMFRFGLFKAKETMPVDVVILGLMVLCGISLALRAIWLLVAEVINP